MHLVVFAIDGTLTDTCQADESCYWHAFRDVFGICEGQPDWSTFCHVTDSVIAAQAWKRYLGREATGSEVEEVRRRLIMLLKKALPAAKPGTYQIAGAASLLALLHNCSDIASALATGAFRASAEFKLQRAGLLDFNLPLASADDAVWRQEIMRIACERAGLGFGTNLSRFTYVGDGVWDVAAAQELGWEFTGIASGEQGGASAPAGRENSCTSL